MHVRGAKHWNFKHGLAPWSGERTSEYRSWQSMLRRCREPKHRGYNRYGAKGITVCERWRTSFLNFLADMGPKPTAAHTIDRISNVKNYEPSNCRWATLYEQNQNRRIDRDRKTGRYRTPDES